MAVNFCDRDAGANTQCKLVARSPRRKPSYSFLTIALPLTLHAGRDYTPGTRVMTPLLFNNLRQPLTKGAGSMLGGCTDVCSQDSLLSGRFT